MAKPNDFESVFAALKPVLVDCDEGVEVTTDEPGRYIVTSRVASPFPQHKGKGLYFGEVRIGKAYVSFHLMPVYMCPELNERVSPALQKRMQGKACFSFKTPPDEGLVADMRALVAEAATAWRTKSWL